MLPPFVQVWRLLRRIEEVFERQDAHRDALVELSDRLGAIDRRVTRLEERESMVIAEARGAAAATGATAAAQSLGDLARRLGALEERSRRVSSPTRPKPPRSLPPSDKDDR